MKKSPLLGAVCALSLVFSIHSHAASFTDFNNFTNGTVDGQDGWKATGAWDEEVVDLGGGNKAWRISNETTSGSFGDQPFAKPSGEIAGESGSTHISTGGSAVTNRYVASFDIWSVTGAAQTGLDVTISPDDGSGSRQSFLSIEDNGSGIDIDFFDTDGNILGDAGTENGGFRFTQAATGLSYNEVHNIAFDITFVDGIITDNVTGALSGNDVVKIYHDGTLIHTGTTWESYFQTTTEGQTPPSVRAIDTLLFRLSTDNGFVSNGGGYYIDNVSISSVPIPAAVWLFGSGLLGLVGIARRKKA